MLFSEEIMPVYQEERGDGSRCRAWAPRRAWWLGKLSESVYVRMCAYVYSTWRIVMVVCMLIASYCGFLSFWILKKIFMPLYGRTLTAHSKLLKAECVCREGIYLCVFVHVCILSCMCASLCVVHVCIFECMCLKRRKLQRACWLSKSWECMYMHVYVWICMRVYLWVFMFVDAHIYICIHIKCQ